MTSTRVQYFRLMLSLAVFSLIYYNAPAGAYRQLLLYCLIPLGLLLAASLPEVIILVNGFGLVLLFTGLLPLWPLTTTVIALLLVGTAIIPFYFENVERRETGRFSDRNDALENELEQLKDRSSALKLKRQNLEDEIDRINQLYVLGRELVEHMELGEVVENVARVLSANPGIRSVSLFSREENRWKPLHISGNLDRERWCLYVEQQSSLRDTTGLQVLPTPDWLGTDKVIFMPVQTEKNLLTALFLVLEKEYAAHYLEKASIFIPQIALGLKRTKLFQEVEERSRHDGLTGLFLRRHFLERLEHEMQRAKRYSSCFSLFLADIDHFKRVNDTYGHLAGDRILCAVADTIAASIRPGDMAGRYGGEEFVVLLPLARPEEAAAIAETIRSSVERREFELDGRVARTSLSIGISHYPGDGSTLREMLAAADAALYWVKNHGRNGIRESSAVKKDTKHHRHPPEAQ